MGGLGWWGVYQGNMMRNPKLGEPEAERIPLMQERATVSKVELPTGKVTIRTISEAHDQVVQETLQSELVRVDRVAVGEEVASAPEVRTVDGVLIVPIVEERLVVEKRLVLVEELHIRRQVQHETIEVPVTLRQQRAVVERTKNTDTPTKRKNRDAT